MATADRDEVEAILDLGPADEVDLTGLLAELKAAHTPLDAITPRIEHEIWLRAEPYTTGRTP